jgi:hypothetical protein
MRMTLFLKLRPQQKVCLHYLLQVEVITVSFHHLCHRFQQISPHQCCLYLCLNLLHNQFLLHKNKRRNLGIKNMKMMMMVQASWNQSHLCHLHSLLLQFNKRSQSTNFLGEMMTMNKKKRNLSTLERRIHCQNLPCQWYKSLQLLFKQHLQRGRRTHFLRQQLQWMMKIKVFLSRLLSQSSPP